MYVAVPRRSELGVNVFSYFAVQVYFTDTLLSGKQHTSGMLADCLNNLHPQTPTRLPGNLRRT